MKIIRIILKLILVLVLLAAIALGVKFYITPLRLIPYPYELSTSKDKSFDDELKKAEKAKVLIIGDQMGLELNKNLQDLEVQTQETLKTNINFFNWSKENESLARSLQKLKSLKKLPSLIIYHGGASEFFEKKFHLLDRTNILENFKKYENDQILSLLITFPDLSRMIYSNDQIIKISTEIKKDTTIYAEGERILAKDLLYKIYQYELRELLEFIKVNNSTLILITPPINYMLPPNEVCPEVNTNTIVETHQEVNDLLKNGDAKEAYGMIKELANEVVGNAQTQYLRGLAAISVGELAEAREALAMAVSFDCKPDRGDPIFNEIMKNEAKNALAFVIDFDLLGKSQIGVEPFFLNNVYPHNLYYKKINEEIFTTLKKILNIK